MKLTNEQLKQNAAAMISFADGKPIQFIPVHNDTWQDYLHTHMMPDLTNRPFRPKPQPASRPWSKTEDVPMNCWLRPHVEGIMYLITHLSEEGPSLSALGRIRWSDMPRFEYSTDRKTWKPCTVEDAQ